MHAMNTLEMEYYLCDVENVSVKHSFTPVLNEQC